MKKTKEYALYGLPILAYGLTFVMMLSVVGCDQGDTFTTKSEDGKNGNDSQQVGPKGEKGEQGIRGETGATGERGARGERGTTGSTGKTGETGGEGPRGFTGLTGLTGPKGDPGNDGVDACKLAITSDSFGKRITCGDVDEFFTCDKKKSKCLQQIEFENVNSGVTKNFKMGLNFPEGKDAEFTVDGATESLHLSCSRCYEVGDQIGDLEILSMTDESGNMDEECRDETD